MSMTGSSTTCTKPKTRKTYSATSGDSLGHYDGIDANVGKCSRCGYYYQNHSQSNTLTGTSDESGHYYACTYPGCSGAFSEEHSGTVDTSNCEPGGVIPRYCYKCKYVMDPRYNVISTTAVYGSTILHYYNCTLCDNFSLLREHNWGNARFIGFDIG